ncbi:MAG: YjbF family lipoprotein [Pacificibacter sp.]|uniref:YjbF family lipoprotein n=1 Tax=Pacificibacter sp. TaxID=1917866 RepID=UPI00321A9CC2
MSRIVPSKSIAVLVVSLLALSACGNDGQARRGTDTVKELAVLAKNRVLGQKTEPPAAPDPVAMIETIMREVPDAPLQFVLLENTGAFAISSIYGQNGNNVTWVTSGKKTMTLASGLLTATRGFGGDVMSVEDGGAAQLITERSAGQVQKTYRFLNGLDQTTRYTVNCSIAEGGTDQISLGDISTTARVMTETCTSNDAPGFTNTYWIDDEGRMVQSVQWGGSIGKIVFSRLRF